MEKETPSYFFSETVDGSPTLQIGQSEKMHNEDGALAETEFIYGRAVDIVKNRGLPFHFAVVGLGLGYIEMMIAARCPHPETHILSFESDPVLRRRFTEWLIGAPSTSADDFQLSYKKILALTAKASGLLGVPTEDALMACLRALWRSGRWRLEGAILKQAAAGTGETYSAILFDAFSSQTSPELWEQDFLENIIDTYAAPACVFATYASTGSLKRALKKRNFQLLDSRGFGRKRESTLAERKN